MDSFPAARFEPSEIVLEINGERYHKYKRKEPNADHPLDLNRWQTKEYVRVSGNDGQLFAPAGDRILRSRFLYSRFGLQHAPANDMTMRLAAFTLDVPGEFLCVDIQARKGRIIDGLSLHYNKDIFLELRNLASKIDMAFILSDPVDPETFDLASDESLWSWIFGMRQIVDQGCKSEGERACRPVKNIESLPSREACIASHKVKLQMTGALAQVLHADRLKREFGYETHTDLHGKLTEFLTDRSPVNGVEHPDPVAVPIASNTVFHVNTPPLHG